MNEIKLILINKIEEYNEQIKDLSKSINRIASLYKSIKKKGNKNINYENFNYLSDNNMYLLDELTENIGPINAVSKKISDLDYEIDKEKSKFQPGSKPYSYSPTHFGSNSSASSTMKLASLLDEKDELMNKMVEMGFDYVINLYENDQNEKEDLKKEKKKYEYILSKINKNQPISVTEIGYLTDLISISENSNTEILLSKLKEYVDNFSKIIFRQTPSKIPNKENVTYEEFVYDTEEEIDEDDVELSSLASNYLNVITSFQNEEDIICFLETISYGKNVHDIFNAMIKLCNDNKIIEILENYLIISNEEDTKNIVEDKTNNFTLWYYDFKGNNKILNDIRKNIPKEEYKNIIDALNMIKKDGALKERKNFIDLRKVHKLRRGNIRVTFRQIDKDLFVILGVYYKNESVFKKEIYQSSKNRNNKLNRVLKELLKMRSDSTLWQTCESEFIGIENSIFELLHFSKNMI